VSGHTESSELFNDTEELSIFYNGTQRKSPGLGAWGRHYVARCVNGVSRDPIIHGVNQITVLFVVWGRNRTNSPSSRSKATRTQTASTGDLDGELGPRGGGGHPLLSLPGRHLPRRRRISGIRTNTSLSAHARDADVILPSNRPTPTVWHRAPPFGAGARLAPVRARRVGHRPRGSRALLQGFHGAAPWQGNQIGTPGPGALCASASTCKFTVEEVTFGWLMGSSH